MKKIFLILLCFCGFLAGLEVLPKSANIYVNDSAKLLSKETKSYISKIGAELNKLSGAQVVVVTIPSLEDEVLEDYATKVFNAYGIGDKTKQNGVLFLLSLKERKFRIATGFGVEGFLNDGKVGRIQDTYIIPYFKKNDFDTGIVAGYSQIVKEIASEYKISINGLIEDFGSIKDSASWLDAKSQDFVESVSAKLKRLTGKELIIATSAETNATAITKKIKSENKNAITMAITLNDGMINTSIAKGNEVPSLPSIIGAGIAKNYIFSEFDKNKSSGVMSGANAIIKGLEKDLNIKLIDKMPSIPEGEAVLDLGGFLSAKNKEIIRAKSDELHAKTGKRIAIATTSDFILPNSSFVLSSRQLLRELKGDLKIVISQYNGQFSVFITKDADIYEKAQADSYSLDERFISNYLAEFEEANEGIMAVFDFAYSKLDEYFNPDYLIPMWLRWGIVAAIFGLCFYAVRLIRNKCENGNKGAYFFIAFFAMALLYGAYFVYFINTDEGLATIAFLANLGYLGFAFVMHLASDICNYKRSGSGDYDDYGDYGSSSYDSYSSSSYDSYGGGSTGGGGSSRSF